MPARAFTADHPPAKSTSASAIAPVFVPRRHLARNAILIALPVIALVAYLYYSRKPQAVESMAVLPFTYSNSEQGSNLGPDANWLSDGITESIINDLSHVPNLKVKIGRASCR